MWGSAKFLISTLSIKRNFWIKGKNKKSLKVSCIRKLLFQTKVSYNCERKYSFNTILSSQNLYLTFSSSSFTSVSLFLLEIKTPLSKRIWWSPIRLEMKFPLPYFFSFQTCFHRQNFICNVGVTNNRAIFRPSLRLRFEVCF